MDEIKLKDDLMARLVRELERPVLQVIDGALSVVLRDYEVNKRETGLSTEVVTWPEYDMFMARMVFGGYSKSTIRQYGTFSEGDAGVRQQTSTGNHRGRYRGLS